MTNHYGLVWKFSVSKQFGALLAFPRVLVVYVVKVFVSEYDTNLDMRLDCQTIQVG